MNIGIIGNGFVGGAVGFGMAEVAEIRTYDVDPMLRTHELDEVIDKSQFLFVTVPTPMSDTGKIDLSIIEDVCSKISASDKYTDDKIVILKSTIVPGTTRTIKEKYNLNLVFNPEFLTERRAKADFINPARIVIGADDKKTFNKLKKLYQKRFRKTPILHCSLEEAEMIKYMCNCFFSVKVSFLNEMRQISDALGNNWDNLLDGFLLDQRIGYSHCSVPGPDGQFGFAGHCFPKDLNAFICRAKELGVAPIVMEAAWEKNLEVRPSARNENS